MGLVSAIEKSKCFLDNTEKDALSFIQQQEKLCQKNYPYIKKPCTEFPTKCIQKRESIFPRNEFKSHIYNCKKEVETPLCQAASTLSTLSDAQKKTTAFNSNKMHDGYIRKWKPFLQCYPGPNCNSTICNIFTIILNIIDLNPMFITTHMHVSQKL